MQYRMSNPRLRLICLLVVVKLGNKPTLITQFHQNVGSGLMYTSIQISTQFVYYCTVLSIICYCTIPKYLYWCNMEYCNAFVSLVLCVVSCGTIVQLVPGEQRNVLVMLVDDGGFEATIYGNDKVKTPNLDALAKKSVVFKNAFTSVSSCSPSRSAILTGLPQHQNGMYGLSVPDFRSYDEVKSLPLILNQNSQISTGIIGKKHVGPDHVYPFPFSYTMEDGYDELQVGRNITFMKELVEKFLSKVDNRDFFLYIGFHDVHRSSLSERSKYGVFCEHFGDGSSPEAGVIPDWHPIDYSPDDVQVPFFLQDTPKTREDLATQYRIVSRMDEGVGLFLQALKDYGFENNTLVIYTSDNGIPFPNAKTNLYDPGMGEPMIVSNPYAPQRWGEVSEAMVGLTDIVPTVLEWFDMKYPDYTLLGKSVVLTGQSLLPILEKEPETGWDTVFSSHDLHEATMYYPMRVLRNKNYKVIKNLNYKMPYPIAQDIYVSPTFQDLLNRTMSGEETHWFKTLKEYYYRGLWELYDIENDPQELKNLANDPSYKGILSDLQLLLYQWQDITNDKWICSPEGVFYDGVCGTLDNDTS